MIQKVIIALLASTFLISSCQNKDSKIVKANAYDRKCSVFLSIPPNKSPKKEIIFLGHSLINEFLINEFLGDNDSIKFINMGIGGDDVHGMYNRRNIAFNRKPYKIFIKIGINDIKNKEDNDSILYYYDCFLNDAKKENMEIYVCNIFPSSSLYTANIKYLNNKLEKICNKYNYTIIDVYSQFQIHGCLNPKYDCGDNTHLSGAGYKKWSEILKTYL